MIERKKIHILLFCLVLNTISAWSQQTLKVNLSTTIRPVTHCASGSLYGITETLPADIANMVAPLKPYMFCQPPRGNSGNQHPFGSALAVSQRLASVPSARVQIALPDILSGWPYNWPGKDNWLALVRAFITDKLATGRDNYHSYSIWNEKEGTWKSTNGDFYTQCWKPTYDLIRSLDPKAKICGPGDSYYNSTRISEFLTFCKNNNCMPEYLSWHQWGSGGIPGAVSNYRQLEKSLGISPLQLCINEYSSKTSDPNEGCPGYAVPFISKFERHGIESACISWWFTALPGRLGSLLTSSNQKGGGWHLYKWYGDMTGNMMQVTPPNDNSDGLDGFACLDNTNKYASICLGGNFTGNASVNISGIPAFFGSSVKVKIEYVVWSSKDTPVASTTLVSNSVYNVSNGSITVPVNVASIYYAYRVYIEPSTTTPTVSIVVPTKDTVVANPSNVLVRANVSDPTAISSLKFFANGVQFGNTLTAAPFSATLAITKAGAYTVTAEITDKSNNKIVSSSKTIRTKVEQAGYDYQSHPIPGTIQLEEYDLGGNGVAYLDNTPGSAVTPVVNYRPDEDVDIETCTDTGGGYNVGYTTAGEWLEYSVNVAKTAKYNLKLRVACNGDGRTVSMTMDDKAFVPTIAVPNTAGWQTWQTVTIKDLQMTAGEHILRLTIGSTDYVNLNYMTFEEVIQVLPPTITLDAPVNQTTIDLGQSLTLSATAADPDGNIIGVSFYAGDNLLTTVNTAPFTYTWTPAAAGTYGISAEAFDTDGLSTKTSTTSVIVQNVVAGLEEKNTLNSGVFPNPFNSDGLKIKQSGVFNYKITDAEGMVVEVGHAQDECSVGKALAQGIYFLTVGNANGTGTHKIIRQ